jgi:hypothetical protein
MALEKLITDVDQTARELRQSLDNHRAAYAARIAKPDVRPLFNTGPDGAVYDRRGLLVRAAEKPKP